MATYLCSADRTARGLGECRPGSGPSLSDHKAIERLAEQLARLAEQLARPENQAKLARMPMIKLTQEEADELRPPRIFRRLCAERTLVS